MTLQGIDELDQRLLAALNEDARQSRRDLARRLGVSLSTISHRLSRLEEEGVIEGYIPLLSAEKMGYELTAIVGLRIRRGKQLLPTQQRIAKDHRVFGVFDATGEWDSLILARFRDRRDLDDFIKGLLAYDAVERTNTNLILNIVKDERRVVVTPPAAKKGRTTKGRRRRGRAKRTTQG